MAEESTLDSTKDSISSPIPDTKPSEPMEVDNKTETEKNNPDSLKVKEEKPSSPESTSSDSLQTCDPPSYSASSSSMEFKQEKDLIKEDKRGNEDTRKGSTNDLNIDVDLTKLKTKTEKMETIQDEMSTRPSSTPPTVTGM